MGWGQATPWGISRHIGLEESLELRHSGWDSPLHDHFSYCTSFEFRHSKGSGAIFFTALILKGAAILENSLAEVTIPH